MTNDARAIRTVAVVGNGIVGLSAAAAFARALPAVTVTLLAIDPDPASLTDQLPVSLPSVHRFHAAIGIDELDLLRSGAALHRLGTRFDNWSATRAAWYHSFAEHGLKAGTVPFHQVWLRARAAGMAEPFDAYSAARALMTRARFAHPSENRASPLSTYLYGLNLDPALYRAALDRACAGVIKRLEKIAAIERRPDGGIAALLLEGGDRVEADLFVDCSGTPAFLSHECARDWVDWSRWLPCDRFKIMSGEPAAVIPYDRVEGLDDGWTWTVPLPGRSLTVRASASQYAASPEGSVTVRLGRAVSPWQQNVWSLGEAATVLDPLHGTMLHLAHSSILRAIDLMPGRKMNPVEVAEYNRLTCLEADALCDFAALLYVQSGRTDTLFWRDSGARDAPPDLARLLEQFSRRGRIPFRESDAITPDSWLACLLGPGVIPQAIDPQALALDPRQIEPRLADLAASLAQLPDRFPPYSDMLRQLVGSMRG